MSFLKGANILVTDLGVIKLADFGASKELSGRPGASVGNTLSATTDKLHGTPNFMAPEALAGD